MNLSLKASLQWKLKLSLLAVVFVTGLGSLIIDWIIIDRNVIEQAYENVSKTVVMYDEMYETKLYVKHRLLSSVASYSVFQKDVESQNKHHIYYAVKELLKETQFDILNVTDDRGTILVRSRNYDLSGDSVASDIYVSRVLKDRQPCYGFDVMEQNALVKEGEALARKAIIEVVPTKRARKPDKKSETRAMVLKAASPIFCDGALVGVIYGALLLNNECTIPDRAKSMVFGDEKVDGKDIGTATLFLDDLRISTNVRNKGGERAIGTMVSQEVYNMVYTGGKIWRDKAFVVDSWYIAAYKPVKDITGKTIGIIYTGIREGKYNKIKREAMTFVLLMILVTATIALILASYLMHYFISPIKALVESAKEIGNGNYLKVNIQSHDEMGYLGEVFNKMVDALIEKDRRLMEHVERRILQTEKLASLGRLASGIAHEINNPLTGVLTYSSTLLEDLKGTEYAEDINVIIEETLRCREIVKGILNFARDTRLEQVRTNLNHIITESLMILEKHVAFQNIKIIKELEPNLPDAHMDINQMKSVINNLAVNAADAMSGGGALTVRTQTSQDGKYLVMKMTDTGVGISEENMLKLFEPFFTTKEPGKGTGLGLAVTYGVVKRHKGFINITSKVGVGTTVEVQIPINTT